MYPPWVRFGGPPDSGGWEGQSDGRTVATRCLLAGCGDLPGYRLTQDRLHWAIRGDLATSILLCSNNKVSINSDIAVHYVFVFLVVLFSMRNFFLNIHGVFHAECKALRLERGKFVQNPLGILGFCGRVTT